LCLGGFCSLGDRFSTENVNPLIALRATILENRSQIDDGIGAFAGSSHRGGITHIGLDQNDLARNTQRHNMASKVRPAASNTDAVAAFGEGPHNVAADEAGSTNQRDEFFRILSIHVPKPLSQLAPAPLLMGCAQNANVGSATLLRHYFGKAVLFVMWAA